MLMAGDEKQLFAMAAAKKVESRAVQTDVEWLMGDCTLRSKVLPVKGTQEFLISRTAVTLNEVQDHPS